MSFDTSAINGSKSLCYASSDGTTYVKVGELKNQNFAGSASTPDANSHDSPSRRQYISGRSGETYSIECNYVRGNSGQQIVRSAYFNSTPVWFKMLMDNAAGGEKFVFKSVITAFGTAGPDEQAVPMTASFNITGDVTIGTILSGDLA